RSCLHAERERTAPAPNVSPRHARGAVTVLSLGGGMQARPPHPSRFLVLDLAIHAIEVQKPTVARIRHQDRDLGEQLRRALTSIALNVAEGNRSQGGHRIARFSTA